MPDAGRSGDSSWQPSAFASLPLGSIRPAGWLQRQLELQADGLTGRLGEIWPDVGPQSAWLGGAGEDWERGPYYCDGLIPLAYLLTRPPLRELAEQWVDWSLVSQGADGFFGPRSNPDWWPRMVMLKALIHYQEATGDDRIIPFLERYFAYQLRHLPGRPLEKWGRARGAENLLAIDWLYQRTGDPSLRRLAELVLDQTIDWGKFFIEFPCRAKHTAGFDHLIHVVNVAMAVKEPALRWRYRGDPAERDAVYAALRNLDHYHGQATGMFSGDEWLAGREPSQGVELCAVVEFMFTLEQLIRLYGDYSFADRLERVAFNHLPAGITADLRARQYDQQWNQVLCSVAQRDWTANRDDSNIFGIEPNFGCCTANLHQGWPKFAASLWLRAQEGLVAAVYAPCQVATTINDVAVTIREDTDYPFGDTVRFQIIAAQPVTFPLLLRVPAWCAQGAVRLNGERQSGFERPGFEAIRRTWRDGDTIELSIPATIQVERRSRGAVAVRRGPLTYALAVGEDRREIPNRYGDIRPFGDWEVYPTTPWNYALILDPAAPDRSLQLERGPIGAHPFAGESPPFRIRARARRVPSWELINNSAGPPPESPVALDTPVETVTLAPFGCARLRVTELPITAERPVSS